MKLRKIPLWIAFVLTLLLVGIEIGAQFLPMPSEGSNVAFIQDLETEEERDQARRQFAADSSPDRPPGMATSSIALIDGLLLWTMLMLVTSGVISQGVHNKLRAIATPIVTLIFLIISLIVLILAIVKLMLMLSLLLAVPFGTIVYMIIFASFNTGAVTIAVGLITLLRAVAFVLLLVSSWRYLKNKTLVFIVITGFLIGLLMGIVFALLPGMLHSIGDAVLAIIIAILGLIWALILFIRSLPGILSLVRF
ncbi:hypothetical protein [Pseudaestuariivita rosea]|uniref:hypothetical protein n=1 Tax=Pseudaestuariivita rosea TaxID=2763263 RepID=UPI001ABB7671|nr:hypothetical protein [Pseudaestuariivita rosea]